MNEQAKRELGTLVAKTVNAAEFSPDHEAYLRRELRKGIEQLDCGQFAEFDARSIIAEQRRRLDGREKD
jgi:hypothetical protein